MAANDYRKVISERDIKRLDQLGFEVVEKDEIERLRAGSSGVYPGSRGEARMWDHTLQKFVDPGSIQGEPLDLTDEERAKLPKLDPDADPNAPGVLGYAGIDAGGERLPPGDDTMKTGAATGDPRTEVKPNEDGTATILAADEWVTLAATPSGQQVQINKKTNAVRNRQTGGEWKEGWPQQ